MGQLDNQNLSDPGGAETRLRSITQELEQLQNSFVHQLSQEVERLQAKKNRLLQETEQLEAQRKELLEQLGPQIQDVLREYLSNYNTGQIDPQISSLSSNLHSIFKTLKQDLSSYQSDLSRQLGQMHTMEQQGEAIIDALVERLRKDLATDSFPSTYPKPRPVVDPSQPQDSPRTPPHQGPRVDPIPKPVPSLEPAPPPKPKKKTVTTSKTAQGLILVLFSSLALSLQNVVFRIILKKVSIFGIFETGQYINPSFGNSLLILFLRMMVVVPAMVILSRILYPDTFTSINRVLRSKDQVLGLQIFGSGFFLFISQVLIYLAFGELKAGVALTIFFIFPIVTVLLAWLLFGARPSWIKGLATIGVFLGVAVIALSPILEQGGISGDLSILGITSGIGSGVTFAFYVLLTQICGKKMHPVPFSVINFAIILILAAISLSLIGFTPWEITVQEEMWPGLILSGGLVVGLLTLASYLTNNIGISYIGAANASIFGATGPALTALLAFLIIKEPLESIEILGMFIVTIGVLGNSIEPLIKKWLAKSS